MGRQDKGKSRGGGGGRDVAISKALSYLLRHAAEKERLKMDARGYANVADVLAWRKLKSLQVTFAEVRDAVETSDKKRFALLHIPSTSTTTSNTEQQQEAEEEEDPASATATALSVKDPNPANFLIRATQGHSIKSVDASSFQERLTLDDESRLPATVVHGTFRSAWSAILASGGLRCMNRNQVHFATGPAVEDVLGQIEARKSNASSTATSGGKWGDNKGRGGNEGVISGMRRDAQVLIYIDLKRALAAGCPFWRSENDVILSEGVSVGGDAGEKMVPTEFFDVVVERKEGLGKIWERGEGIL